MDTTLIGMAGFPSLLKRLIRELAEDLFLRRHDPDQVLGFAVLRLRSMDHPKVVTVYTNSDWVIAGGDYRLGGMSSARD